MEGAEKTAVKLRQEIEATEFIISLSQDHLKQIISIGVSEYKQGEPIDAFIARADKAVYMARRNGKNQVVRIQD